MQFRFLMLSSVVATLFLNVPSHSMEREEYTRESTRPRPTTSASSSSGKWWGARFFDWLSGKSGDQGAATSQSSATFNVNAQTTKEDMDAIFGRSAVYPTAPSADSERKARIEEVKRQREQEEREREAEVKRKREEEERLQRQREEEKRREELHQREEKLQSERKAFEEEKRREEEERLTREREELELEKKRIAEEKQRMEEELRQREAAERERVRREEEDRREKLRVEEERIRQEREKLERDRSLGASSSSGHTTTATESYEEVAQPGSLFLTLGTSAERDGNSWRVKVPNLSTIRVFESMSQASSADVARFTTQPVLKDKTEYTKSMKWVRAILKARGKKLDLAEKANRLYEAFASNLDSIPPQNIRIILSSSTGGKTAKDIDTAYVLVTIDGGQVIFIRIPGE